MTIPLLLVLALAQEGEGPELTSGRQVPPEQSCYDVKSYGIWLVVDPEKRSISGRVGVVARLIRPSDELVLDLDDRFQVTGVWNQSNLGWGCWPCAAGTDLEYTHSNGELRFRTPRTTVGSEFHVRVDYSGKPRVAPNLPWDGGFVWDKTPSGDPWIATANQMQGGDLWWPCKDQPNDEADSANIFVTVPEPLVVASNGRLVDIEPGFDPVTCDELPGWRTYQWVVSTPINTYGIALNIAPYETISRDYTSTAGDVFPVTYWVLPENLDKGKVLFEDILRQLRFFEGVFGPYPFRADKYGVAETPHLGMEHQTIIAYGNDYKLDRWGEDRGYDELHLHELAHEWWANLVTAENWNDFWIHEGFASYAQALYAEHIGGMESYFTEMQEQLGHANLAAIAPRGARSTAEMYFGDRPGSPGGDIYGKGAWVVHTLRWLLTDELFFPALRRMAYPDPALEKSTDGSACRFTTTDEIQAIAEREGHQELGWFFEVYVRQPALPVLGWRVQDGVLLLEWKSPVEGAFPMPVEVRVGDQYLRVECPDGKGSLDLGGRQDFVVDPRARVLRAAQ